MNTIQIGTNQQSFCDVSESWIHQQVGQRKDEGQNVCVTVALKNGSINLLLATPGCSHVSGGGRMPNEKEQEILNLWQQLHLNDSHWTAGNLIAFVKQARRFAC